MSGKEVFLHVRMTDDQMKALKKAAKKARDKNLSTFIREIANELIAEEKKDAKHGK